MGELTGLFHFSRRRSPDGLGLNVGLLRHRPPQKPPTPAPPQARQNRRTSEPPDGADAAFGGRDKVLEEATALARAGRLGASLALLNQGIADKSDDAELLYARGLTLFDWGRAREALEDLRAAETRGFSGFGLQLNLAQACHLLGLIEESEQRVRQAIALDGTVAAAHIGLGVLLQTRKQFEEAIESHERARALALDREDCLSHIVACKLELRDGVAAEALAREAISRYGDEHVKFWGMLGAALAMQDRLSEAIQAFEHAEAIESRTGAPPETFATHAFQLLSHDRLSEALGLYARYLPLNPDPGAHAHCGFALLTAGYLRQGWPLYEFRWCSSAKLAAIRPRFGRPEWSGQDLHGKTLLLWGEQGVGDTVQFVRFVSLLKERGANVVLQVPRVLRDFAGDFRDVDRVIVSPGELESGFDYYIPTMSVPRVLATDLDSIPASVPYLTVESHRRRAWREKLGFDENWLKVGLAWAGNPDHERDRYRTMPLSSLDPLFSVEGVRYFSLQKERRPCDVARVPPGVEFVDLASELGDFRDTAAAIDALDLVICVDTAVAHIAGALAKPVWLMLPAAGDFRWLRDRTDSPWYPTMRVFRQQRLGDWGPVVVAVRAALQEALKGRGPRQAIDLLPRPALSPKAFKGLGDAVTRLPLSEFCAVADTRYGVFQHSPREGALSRSLACYGEWLQQHLDLLAGLLKPGAVVVEAGAGIGFHAVALAGMIGAPGHLLAYEADPILRRILGQNLQNHQLRAVVTLMQRNLGEPEPDARPPAEEQPVVTETLDELGLPRLDLLKINQRANAMEVLAGGADTVWRLRPLLFTCAADDEMLKQCANRARDFGYRCWRVETPLYNPANFNRNPENIFGDETASALLATPEEAEIGHALDRFEEV